MLFQYKFFKKLKSKISYFHSTDDGESSEKTHCSTNCRQDVNKLYSFILGNSVICWCVKINPYKL